MTNPNKPLAKSLHTVSVLVAIARANGPASNPGAAVAGAMKLLSLGGRADPYGLEAAAVRQLSKESAQ